MVFESTTGFEQNKKVQLALAAIMVVLVSGFFIRSKIWVSDKQHSLSGTYRNECCSDIIIKDGFISQGKTAFDWRIVTMKDGLTGAVGGRFTVDGLQKSAEPAMILLNEEGRRALSVRIDGRDYTFQLIP
jgi:hypothetical protein